ncbi:hypothetical protein D9C73_017890 [Collichthys lucidus]|uniref:Uncharacterized protein n=1 Tax=Collichthys lucidus TaxID=240159 RepID=A0A4U5V759_COLLU|nr:hypothetical protein D9C73_017890 [Collichthys lucidus]
MERRRERRVLVKGCSRGKGGVMVVVVVVVWRREPRVTWLQSRSESRGGGSSSSSHELDRYSAEQPGEDVPNCSGTKETSLFIKD